MNFSLRFYESFFVYRGCTNYSVNPDPHLPNCYLMLKIRDLCSNKIIRPSTSVSALCLVSSLSTAFLSIPSFFSSLFFVILYY